jgi:predicted GTPase
MAIGGTTRVVILGAAGRDFHNFNMVYRDDPTVTVVAFTATQIPGIAGRRYPASLTKVDAAEAADVQAVVDEAHAVNPTAAIVRAASPVRLDDPAAVRGRRVIVVEDGPTITHGGMSHGAGYVAAVAAGATIVDPRVSADPTMCAVFAQYPHIGKVVPAIGYDARQLAALRATLNRAEADVVVPATPLGLTALVALDKPVVRARYEFADAGTPTLGALVDRFLARGDGRRAV